MGGRIWRRRLAAAGVLVVAVVLAVAGVRALTGGRGSAAHGDTTSTRAARPRPRPVALPRGGRTILPRTRVVAYYGAPQDPELGALGIGTPDQAARRLLHTAAQYRSLGRPVLPAMELLAAVADRDPGPDGMYRTRQSDAVIRRYLAAARRVKALLILDIQPGRADFFRESVVLRKWLVQPDVSLALDPEWHVAAPGLPGKVIGTVDAAEINAVSFWLDRLVRTRHLPQKLLLVHRFTDGMIQGFDRLKTRPHLAVTINVDGFGDRAIKRAKYRAFMHDQRGRGFGHGFKLFFKEDTNMFSPADVGRLIPQPDVIDYE